MARVSIFLIAVALIVGMVGCIPVQYNLTIDSTCGGVVTTPGEGTFTYYEGEVVNLVAEAEEDYEFINWTGDVYGITNVADASTTIAMNDDYSITAEFAVKHYDLTVRSTEGGSVTAPGEGAFTYDEGTVVNLVAQPDEGYQFMKWTGSTGAIADVYAAETTITINHDCYITANFAGAIRDWYDLNAIKDNLDGNYIMVNDLDSTTAGYEDLASLTADAGKGWEPIGRLSSDPVNPDIVDRVNSFTGIFDGWGYEIRDLFIGRPDEDGVGLFGHIDEGGVVKNLGIANTQVSGRSDVGSLAGHNQGTVTGSYSGGSVTGVSRLGGLVGRNRGGVIDSSYSSVDVTGEWGIGGLVGMNNDWATVSNSHSSGTVAGYAHCIGGLVGLNFYGAVNDCYCSGSVTGDRQLGGLVGGNLGTVSNSHYNYDNVLINGRHIITVGALFGEDFDAWLANNEFLNVNERLSQQDGYYLISSVSDFKQLLVFGQNSSLKFRLTIDLDLGDEPNFYIPYLGGEFDGNGHKISNLSLNSRFPSEAGLFGVLASGGRVTQLGVENAHIAGGVTVGGVVGVIHYGTVSNSYSSSTVTSGWQVGGLVGHIHWGTVSNSYAGGSVTGNGNVGGLVGHNDYGTVSNSHYNYDNVLINGRHIITVGALSNEDFNHWLTDDKFLDIDERLSKEDGYYLINDVTDFRQLLAFGQDGSLKFRLKSDLDLGNEPNFYIPYLAGEFDGNGHKISDLSFDYSFVSNVGLFGYLASGGKVSEVSVERASITGAYIVGGVVGSNRQDSSVSDSCASGSVTAGDRVGGLVGWNDGFVNNSCFTGSVTGYWWSAGGLVGWNAGTVSKSCSTSSVTGENEVGGLVGYMYGGTVSNSCSSGSVTGERWVGGLVGENIEGTLSNSYSACRVTGKYYVGGLVGTNWHTVSNSFWDIQTSGQATSDGGTGKTTAEMKNITTFSDTGWNIIAVANSGIRNSSYIWNIVDGQTYPFLSWEL